jgi:hypothetical protein
VNESRRHFEIPEEAKDRYHQRLVSCEDAAPLRAGAERGSQPDAQGGSWISKIAALWLSLLLLGYVGEHGIKGLLEAVLGLGTRRWECG